MTAPTFDIIASGSIVESCDTLDDALFQVSIREDEDIDNGTYEPDSYQIVRSGAIIYTANGSDEVEYAAYTKMGMKKALQDCAYLKDNGHNPVLVTREVYNAAGDLLARDEEASE